MLNPRICNHCTNAYKETCVAECAPTGNYCAFDPRPLREGEQPPPFPVVDFLEMTAREARVLMGLYLYWQSQQQMAGGQSPFHDDGHSQPIYLRERLVGSPVQATAEDQSSVTTEPASRPKSGGGAGGVTGA